MVKTVIKKIYAAASVPLKIAMSFSGGLVLAMPFISGSFSPFAAPFAAALDGIYSISAFLGSAAGFFVFHSGLTSFRYFAVLVVSTSALRISVDIFRIRQDRQLKILCPCISAALINLIYLFSQKASPGLFAAIAVETALTTAAVPVFTEGIKQLRRSPLHFKKGDEKNLVCLLLLLSAFTAHLKYYENIGTAFGLFADFLLIMLMSYFKKPFGGVIAGVCCGFTFALDGSADFLCVTMPLCGCVCDFFELNRYLNAAAAFLCAAAGCAMSDEIKIFPLLPAAGAACAVMCLIPKKFFGDDRVFEKRVESAIPVISKNAAHIAKAVENISGCMTAVRESIAPFCKTTLESELEKARKRVCCACEIKESCVNDIRSAGADLYKKIAAGLTANDPEIKLFPDHFESTCYCSGKMTEEMKKAYFIYKTNAAANNRINRMQAVAGNQFKTFGGIIGSACTTLEKLGTCEYAYCRELAACAKESGLDVKEAKICKDKIGRDYLELEFTKPDDNFSVTELKEKISSDTGYDLDTPTLMQNGREYTLIFKQRETLGFKIAAASVPSTGKDVCGDYYRCFKDTSGRQIVLLSDGMGTGGRAAIDSAFTCETVYTLIKAGIDENTAVAAVNSAMIMKSTDESLATVDMLRLDPVLGTAEFFKCGAAPSFISKGKNSMVLEPESTPVGILDNINMAVFKTDVDEGDVLLLVSDGVSCERYKWICGELGAQRTQNAAELARHILTCARDRQLGKRLDDMTVITVIVRKK